MHTHYVNAYKVLRNLRREVALTLNAQLSCTLALFGKGNTYMRLQLVLQAIMICSAFLPVYSPPMHCLDLEV